MGKSGNFQAEQREKPVFVAGVPPDYFSSTGQLWGHPVYDWDVLKETGYLWWIRRIEHNLKFFHMFRLDHFRDLSVTGKFRQVTSSQQMEDGKKRLLKIFSVPS